MDTSAGGREDAGRAGGQLEKEWYTKAEVEVLLRAGGGAAAGGSGRTVHPLLEETFTPNDPVHGLIHLPAIARAVVDTDVFQRMRHIKQLGICILVYPGATHDRFFHSIGTAFLAHELVKGLRHRQPELGITDRDATCVLLAALCHDLGHPCYSHMFEVFLHELGRSKRRVAEAAMREQGRTELSSETEEELRRYEGWTHEEASLALLDGLFLELEGPLSDVGLREDSEGNDFQFIKELIDPPKKKLEASLERKELAHAWPTIMKGRPVDKAFLYEVVSNWRSGIDIDKFDYFRRDALFLGIKRQFDHDRYIKGIKVMPDELGIPTVMAQMKDKDSLYENMMELRKMLHRTAYQHKTVKKLELHMIDILKMADEAIVVTGSNGRKMRMSEAAIALDPVAYPKLTDTFVEARLLDGENPALDAAAAEYRFRVVRRHLMRLVMDWELPRVGEAGLPFAAGPLEIKDNQSVIDSVHALYEEYFSRQPDVRAVPAHELRCQTAAFHYGMGARDPLARLHFHRKGVKAPVDQAADVKPLRQKIFIFWNPSEASDEHTLSRLNQCCKAWANKQVEQHERASGAPSAQAVASSPSAAAGAKRRRLRMHSSATVDIPMPEPLPAPRVA